MGGVDERVGLTPPCDFHGGYMMYIIYIPRHDYNGTGMFTDQARGGGWFMAVPWSVWDVYSTSIL